MTKLTDFLAQRRKAIVAFVTPGVSLLIADGIADQALPTAHEWYLAGAACVLTALGVHQVRNRRKA